ncbi:MAG TPA: DUF4442 domain-containing protein [Steroidobacteraceae bacterium]|nr:DUF4442 domain-containing protein [Steroidobacteraceae bacterium]
MRPAAFRRLINLWPPFLFNGITVMDIAQDWSAVAVRLRLRRWNRNYFGTHFGGNLFAMTDPFWALIAFHRLGAGYIVWDRAASIEFLTPGRSDVYAKFAMDAETVDGIRAQAAAGAKVLQWFETDVSDERGEVIARVRKQLYIRRKDRPTQ